jgi:hypothetical protein
MLERLEEFRRYLYANGESLVNSNHARIAGERVSTAHVESTVNQLINWQICKKQQMRWSASGAQPLLHVRTGDLNGPPRALCWPSSSRRRHPSRDRRLIAPRFLPASS